LSTQSGDDPDAERAASSAPLGDNESEDRPGAPELGQKVRVALRWGFINSVVSRAGQLAVGIVLAHLIAPEQFGVYAAALVVINVILSVSELGVTVPLVRHRGDVSLIAPTVTTLSLASSGTLTLIAFLGAPAFAGALGAPEATGVIRLMSLAILIAGFSAVPASMLQRGFRQDHKLVADSVSFLLSTAVVVVMALLGFGPWALAWSRIVGNGSAAVVMFLFMKKRYWPGWNGRLAREVLAFSLPLAGASLLVFGVLNVDYVVVGSILGPVELGFYLIAFNLSSWSVTAFSTTIRGVSLAGFSELRDDERRMKEGFARSLSILMSLTIPACILLAALNYPLIGFVYGERWLPSATPLAVLSILGALRVALELAYDYLAAVGRTRAILVIHFVWLAALIPSLAVGAHLSGILGVAWGHVVTVGLIITPAYIWVLARNDVKPGVLSRGLVRPVVGGVVMAAVAVVVSRSLSVDFWRLAVGGTLSLGAYVAIVLPGFGGLSAIRRRSATISAAD
jgi:O-antigen/teichoic acid export membrane protein